MTYFFKYNNKEDLLVKKLLENMSGILINKDKIFIICERCKKNLSHQNVEYILFYQYPGRGLIKSNDYVKENVCDNCFSEIRISHEVIKKIKIYY